MKTVASYLRTCNEKKSPMSLLPKGSLIRFQHSFPYRKYGVKSCVPESQRRRVECEGCTDDEIVLNHDGKTSSPTFDQFLCVADSIRDRRTDPILARVEHEDIRDESIESWSEPNLDNLREKNQNRFESQRKRLTCASALSLTRFSLSTTSAAASIPNIAFRAGSS